MLQITTFFNYNVLRTQSYDQFMKINLKLVYKLSLHDKSCSLIKKLLKTKFTIEEKKSYFLYSKRKTSTRSLETSYSFNNTFRFTMLSLALKNSRCRQKRFLSKTYFFVIIEYYYFFNL